MPALNPQPPEEIFWKNRGWRFMWFDPEGRYVPLVDEFEGGQPGRDQYHAASFLTWRVRRRQWERRREAKTAPKAAGATIARPSVPRGGWRRDR